MNFFLLIYWHEKHLEGQTLFCNEFLNWIVSVKLPRSCTGSKNPTLYNADQYDYFKYLSPAWFLSLILTPNMVDKRT